VSNPLARETAFLKTVVFGYNAVLRVSGYVLSVRPPAQSPGTRTCAQLRSHVGRLSTLPPLHQVSETELVAGWCQCTICPVHAVTAQAFPPCGVLHRVGAVAQLPYPIRMLPAHVERRKLSSPGLPLLLHYSAPRVGPSNPYPSRKPWCLECWPPRGVLASPSELSASPSKLLASPSELVASPS
jgi:hypothetical protein